MARQGELGAGAENDHSIDEHPTPARHSAPREIHAAVRRTQPFPGWRTLQSGGRWIRRRFVRRAGILGYHRVSEPGWDPFDLAVSPANFAAHLQLIRERFIPMPLTELAARLQEGSLPEGAVAVTFDDGYRDNLTRARPLLERYAIPATVFIVSGSLGREVWWDRLATMLAPSTPLPSTLRLRVDGSEHTLALDQGDSFHSRRELVATVGRLIMRRSPAQIEEALRSLAAALGEPPIATERSLMDGEELVELAESELIEIGSHTATHPFLADLPLTRQRDEVFRSKAHLERLLGRDVRSFSYPNGSSSEQTRQLVRDAGYACACGSRPDIVWRGSDPFDLPRLWQPDQNGEAFTRWIRRFL